MALPSCSSTGTQQGQFTGLDPLYPGETLAADEMRISFLGTSCIPRLAQECNNVFVECCNGEYFVLTMAPGCQPNIAMGVPYSKQDKIFLTHLYGDHTSDLITVYCLGPANDRKVPLKICGPTGV